MRFILIILLIIINTSAIIAQDMIYNFDKDSDLKKWMIVNDDVMGGISRSNININNQGNGVFSGSISTANNGGFCSLRYSFNRKYISDKTNFKLKIKGDGKAYQLRIKANRDDYFSYILKFETSGEWEVISMPIKDMYASFRGRKLNIQNFSNNYFEQITILVGNKRNEEFNLLIDEITLD